MKSILQKIEDILENENQFESTEEFLIEYLKTNPQQSQNFFQKTLTKDIPWIQEIKKQIGRETFEDVKKHLAMDPLQELFLKDVSLISD